MRGFTPDYKADLQLNGLSNENFIVLAKKSALQLKWNIMYLGSDGIIAFTNTSLFSWKAEIKIHIENGMASVKSSSSEIVDWGKNKKNVKKFLAVFEDNRVHYTAEELSEKYLELTQNNLISFDSRLTTPAVEDQGIGALFIPTKDYFITPLLIDANMLIFLIMALTGVNIMLPDNASMLSWGANFRPLTLDGQWWRLVTNFFLHIGVIHLLMNMYALFFIGLLLEPQLGRMRFVTAYMLTGIMASTVSLWWHENTISAGASGAIFGMYGFFLAMLTSNLIEKKRRKASLAGIALFVGYNLMYGMKGGIDNAAHLGGLICGITFGYASIPGLKKPTSATLKYGPVVLLTVVVFALSIVICKNTSNDIGKYETAMKEFDTNEKLALAVYRLPGNTRKEQLIKEIKDKGINYWSADVQLINEVEKLHLPAAIRERNIMLKKYCELRIKSYNILYRYIEDGGEDYKKQLDDYNQQIKAEIDQLDSLKDR